MPQSPPERAKAEESTQVRSGSITGARIILLIEHGKLDQNSAGVIASVLGMEESYVRRVCRTMAGQGILTVSEVKQRGTPPVKIYTIVKPKK